MAEKQSWQIRPVGKEDRPWLKTFLGEHWGSHKVVSRGQVHDASRLAGFVAEQGDRRLGLVTYRLAGGECEIVTLNSVEEFRGIGSALVAEVSRVVGEAGASRLWLICTNDNLKALGFYQKRGFVLARVHRDAVKESRRLKPEIPLLSPSGISIRDEIELEMSPGSGTD